MNKSENSCYNPSLLGTTLTNRVIPYNSLDSFWAGKVRKPTK